MSCLAQVYLNTVFQYAMKLIGGPLYPQVQVCMEQIVISPFEDLAILCESDTEKVFQMDKDILRCQQLGMIIKDLQLEMTTSGLIPLTDTMTRIQGKILCHHLLQSK